MFPMMMMHAMLTGKIAFDSFGRFVLILPKAGLKLKFNVNIILI